MLQVFFKTDDTFNTKRHQHVRHVLRPVIYSKSLYKLKDYFLLLRYQFYFVMGGNPDVKVKHDTRVFFHEYSSGLVKLFETRF